MQKWLVLAFACVAVSLAACGNGSQSALLTGGGGGPCPAIGVILPTLAYPAPNATNVPINAGVLVFYSYANPAVIPMDIQINVGGAAIQDLGLMKAAPSVIPGPTAPPPSPAPANMGSVALPVLQRGTAYTVTEQSPSGVCPVVGNGTLGTFTTSAN